MDRKGYIKKKKKGTGLYEDLHLEGLEVLQKLSGAVWTDYNEHDPGVTLLENISYALTELIHKTELPIQDLLIQKEGEELRSGDNGLFVASDILTTDPITFNDYRKIWIDQITNVKNVWIHPVDVESSSVNNAKGFMYVYVEKYVYAQEPEEELIENQRIIKEVIALYNDHRNLCEDIYKVEIYEPLFLTLELEVSLSEKVDGEEILATILNKINNYLTPEVNYYPLWKLQEKGMSANEIFNGPRLSNGFILDEDLKDPLKEIIISDIIKIIARIDGILSIANFCLKYTDKKSGKEVSIRNRLNIPVNTAPVVSFPAANEKLIFENSGIFFQPDLAETKKQLSFIQALDYGNYRAASTSLNRIPIPQGTYKDINYHYPIRKQFPELYGIGDVGISANATPLRKAQVKQLQAYLMPIDQLMVNFLSQLSNLYTLYDVHNTIERSYFTKELPDLDDLIELIRPPENYDDISVVKSYWDTLVKALNTHFDAGVLERFDAIADQLLARYNEEFRTYALRKINSNSYGEALTSDRFEKEALAMKRAFIASYDSISYTRARAFNYHALSETGVQKNQKQLIPGLFRKIAILTGMNDFRIQSLTKILEDSGVIVHPKAVEIELKVREIDIHTPEEDIAIVTIEDVVVNEVIEEDLYKAMHYVGTEDSILSEILKNGVLSQNYTIKKDPNTDDKYYILYKRGITTSNIAHICDSREHAVASIKKAINYLVALSHKSEGFFVLEHLLLLPPYHGDYFGFYLDFSLLMTKVNLRIQHHEQTSCNYRNRKINTLLEQLYLDELQYKGILRNDCYTIEIVSSEGEILAISKDRYDSEKEWQDVIKELQNELSLVDKEQLSDIVQCYVYYGAHAVKEDFFSFRMSFILPSWPVRFQNESFRMMFENIVYEHLPIHLVAKVYWLDYKVVHLFEAYYFRWQELMIDDQGHEDRVYQAYQLITMLQELEQQYDEF